MTSRNTLFQLARTLSEPRFSYGGNEGHRRMVTAVEAVDAVKRRGNATINEIATELGIDQSGASRLMSQAIAAGLVQRDRADADGRARECGLTPEGEELLQSAIQRQNEVFLNLTIGWTDGDRETFNSRLREVLEAAKELHIVDG